MLILNGDCLASLAMKSDQCDRRMPLSPHGQMAAREYRSVLAETIRDAQDRVVQPAETVDIVGAEPILNLTGLRYQLRIIVLLACAS